MVGTETPPRPDALWRVNAIARYVGRISHNNANLYPEDPAPWQGNGNEHDEPLAR